MDLFEVLTPARILVEEQTRALLEFNGCHAPSNGQFCSAYGPGGRHTRKGKRKRAKAVAAKVGAALARTTDPARRRSLQHRGQVAKAVLDHLKATGIWGTWTGATHTAKRIKYPPRLSHAFAERWSDEARAAAIAARRARAAQVQKAGGLTKSLQGHVARRVAASRAAAFKKAAPEAPSSARFDKTVKPEKVVRSAASGGGSGKKKPKTRAPRTKPQNVPKGDTLKVRCRTPNALGGCV